MLFSKQESIFYKGIAILMIGMCHFMGRFGHGIRIFTPLGGIGVAIFLIFSGYGLNESWNKHKKRFRGVILDKTFWRKRIIAVFIPYIVIQLVFYWPFHLKTITAITFIKDITFLKPLYCNGWFLQYLLLLYVCFYIIKVCEGTHKHSLIIFAIIMFILFWNQPQIKAEQSFSFLFGLFLSEYVDDKNKFHSIRLGIFLIAVAIICLALKQFPQIRNSPIYITNFVQLCITFPCSVGIIILLYHLSVPVSLNKIVTIAGIYSYEIYLIHGYLLDIVPNSILGALIFVLITIILSWLYHIILNFSKPFLFKLLHI